MPGVNDPKEARKLVRKGHCTYMQAQNATKFGTWESLAYDAHAGIVIGGYATGISFCLNSLIYFLETDDPQEALRATSLVAGKIFVTAFSVSAAASQLYRITTVQIQRLLQDLKKLICHMNYNFLTGLILLYFNCAAFKIDPIPS